MMKSIATVAAAAVCAMVAVSPSTVADLTSALPSFSNSTGYASADTVEVRRDSAKAASDRLSPAQKARARASRVGALGVKAGAAHHTEIVAGYRWNACAPLRLALNADSAPKGAVADFRIAVDKIRQGSGLDLRIVATTDAAPVEDWAASRGQGDWRPVLVSWGRSDTGVLGDGASATTVPYGVTNSAGQGVWVSGQMRFNTDNDYMYARGFGAYGSRVLLYMHELGHLVGLDHVQDADQMMFSSVSRAVDAGSGDLAGLRRAGQGGCVSAPTPAQVG